MLLEKIHRKENALVVCRFVLINLSYLILLFYLILLDELFDLILLSMLGFPNGTFTKKSFFGNVSQDFIMDSVHCNGTEKDIRCSKSFKTMTLSNICNTKTRITTSVKATTNSKPLDNLSYQDLLFVVFFFF